MKKLSMIFAGLLGAVSLAAADTASWTEDFLLSAGVKFETEHVFRGRREMKTAFVPYAELGYVCFEDGEIYLGVNAALGLNLTSAVRNQVSPYVGFSYEITDMFTVDVGYVHYFYTAVDEVLRAAGNVNSIKAYSDEIYVGLLVDVLLSPKVYASYDFTRQEIVIEGQVGHFFDLSDHILSGLGVDLGVKLGYDSANKPYGVEADILQGNGVDTKRNYFYYGATADLVYEFNANAKVRAGVAYEGNSAKDNAWPNIFAVNGSKKGGKNSLWFNAAVDCSF